VDHREPPGRSLLDSRDLRVGEPDRGAKRGLADTCHAPGRAHLGPDHSVDLLALAASDGQPGVTDGHASSMFLGRLPWRYRRLIPAEPPEWPSRIPAQREMSATKRVGRAPRAPFLPGCGNSVTEMTVVGHNSRPAGAEAGEKDAISPCRAAAGTPNSTARGRGTRAPARRRRASRSARGSRDGTRRQRSGRGSPRTRSG
jgi:hypothetical protein